MEPKTKREAEMKIRSMDRAALRALRKSEDCAPGRLLEYTTAYKVFAAESIRLRAMLPTLPD